MDLKEIVSHIRAMYIEDLLSVYQQQSGGAKEALISVNTDEPIEQFKLWRIDYIKTVEGKVNTNEVNSDRYISFEPINLEINNMEAAVAPFYWNGCEFMFSPKPDNYDWLIAWIDKWINEADDWELDENGLLGAIHNVTKPIETDDGMMFSVDFGSAGIEAFNDIINEIYQQGVLSLKIGSFSMIDN